MSASIAEKSPYKGLLPYGEEDKDLFFGRNSEIRTVASNALASRWTVFYGASGVGKSSVLRAGVVPFIRTIPETRVCLFRHWQGANFEEALIKELGTIAPEIAERLNSSDLELAIATLCESIDDTFVIILDQFEEYLLYHGRRAAVDFETRLARSVNNIRRDVRFVVSLREDSLAGLDRLRVRIPDVFNNVLRLHHLDRAAAKDAIIEPLRVFHEMYPHLPQVGIEDALIDKLLDEVGTGKVVISETGTGGLERHITSGRVEAPYLQLALKRLWNDEAHSEPFRLRLDTFTRLGGAAQIVRSHLEEVLGSLSDQEQEMCARIFDRLVTPSGAKIAYSEQDLAQFANTSEELIRTTLEKLASGERRILRAVPDPMGRSGTSAYEIYHDVLAQPILSWRKNRELEQRELSAVQRTEVAYSQERNVLKEAKSQAERESIHQSNVAARERSQKFKIALGASIVSTVLAIAALIAALQFRNAATIADERYKAAIIAQSAFREASGASSGRTTSPADGAGSAPTPSPSAPTPSPSAPTPSPSAPTPSPSAQATLYVQIPSKEYSSTANSITYELRSRFPQIFVPQYEIIPWYRGGTQLRFFNASDRRLAEMVFGVVRRVNPKASCIYIGQGAINNIPETGQFELWLGPGTNEEVGYGFSKDGCQNIQN